MAEKVPLAQSVSVDLSVSEKVKSLSSEHPVNIEVVTEIRQKVSEGMLPIDLNAITNKLFESIKEARDNFMDIKALIQNLEALNDSLNSTISENDDFENCVRRFQAKLADLIRVYKSSGSTSSKDLKQL